MNERNCGSKTFYRTSLNQKSRRPQIPIGGSGPLLRLQFTRRCNHTSRKVTKMDTRRARVLCLTSSCVHFSIFFKYLFRVRINCKRTCEPVPPLFHSCRSASHLGMEFTSNNLRLHVPTAGDTISTLRFARFHAAPKHGARPHTSVSAETPHGAMFALRPQRKDVQGQPLGLSLNPEPSHSIVRCQLSSTESLARFNESEGSPTGGERCAAV